VKLKRTNEIAFGFSYKRSGTLGIFCLYWVLEIYV